MKQISKKLDCLQVIRAIACLMIVFCHTDYSGAGQTGVDLFFVISGFVIMLSTEKPFTIKSFALKRIKRIVPLYWTVTIILSLLIVLKPQLFRTSAFSWEYLFKSLLFIPYTQNGVGGPILAIAWTLNLEVFFYFLFGLASWISRKYRGIITIGLIAILVTITYIWDLPYVIRFWGLSVTLEFAWGIIVYYVWKYLKNVKADSVFLKNTLTANIIFWVLLLSGIVLMEINFAGKGNTISRPFDVGLIAALIVAVSILLNDHLKTPKVLKYMGDKCYEIYLLHLFPVRLFSELLYKLAGRNLLSAFLAVILSLLTLQLLYQIMCCIVYRKKYSKN